jgi:hypothetical protein
LSGVTPGPKPMIDERMFVPADLEQARQLCDALIGAGTRVARARALVTWLITLPERRSEDPSPNTLRRDYRRELQRLGRPPWPLDEGGRSSEYMGAYVSSRRIAA